LAWNTGRDPIYRHYAEVHTNDPAKPTLLLVVQGKVRMRVGIDPRELIFPSLRPDEGGAAKAVIYSQVWDDLEFLEGVPSGDGIRWEVEQAGDDILRAYEAKTAYDLVVHIPPGIPRGPFSELVRFRIKPGGGADEEADFYEIPLRGEVLGRLAVIGPAVDENGVLDLGIVPRGRETKKRVMLKVRDEQKELRVTSVETVPEFIKVTFLPYKENDAGLSYLEFEVPSDAPSCSYRGQPYGHVFVAFDHPRLERLEMKVKVAIVESQ
jgi:hypothetical protein